MANNDAAFDKLKVLSDLSVATESTSFYFDDLTDLRRYDGRFDSLIKSDDKDIILLFKELEEENYIPIWKELEDFALKTLVEIVIPEVYPEDFIDED